MSEARQVFVDHLMRTRSQKTVKQNIRLTSSLIGGHKDITSVSRLEINAVAGALPIVRSQLLSRVDDIDESRFLLDQTIDLNNWPAGGGAATKVVFVAWDNNGEKTRLVPIDAFMSFPGTGVRLFDDLLPVPELVEQWTSGPGAPDREVIELTLRPLLPPPLDDWLSPQLQSIRFEIDAADRRLYRAAVARAGGQTHVADVSSWTVGGGVAMAQTITVTDFDGGWTQTQVIGTTELSAWGADKFTRLRLDQNAF
jgi:hypothetical protein